LMAWADEPERSFNAPIAAFTMSAIGGCAGVARGFFGPFAAADLAFFSFFGEAAAGAAAGATAASDMMIVVCVGRE